MRLFNKTTALALVFLFMSSFAFADDNEGKKKISTKAINISLGYSYGPITSMISYTDPIMMSRMTQQVVLNSDYCNNVIGVASFGVGLEFSETVEFDALFSYAHNHGKLKYEGGFGYIPDYALAYTEDWFTLMPGIKVNWLKKQLNSQRKGMFKLYSKVNIGCTLCDRYEITDLAETINSKGAFAFQVVPIGMEVGTRKFRFFAEAGYGYTGYARAGFKLRILRDNGDDNSLKSDSWYKDYLKMK